MKKTRSGIRKKPLLVILAAGFLLTVPVIAANENPAVPVSIRETLQERVKLLSRLVADYEKQFENGSLDGNLLTGARTELYVAKILLMKAEQGRAAVPGIAVAILRDLVARRQMNGKYDETRLRQLMPRLAKADPARLDGQFLQALLSVEKE